MGICSGTNAARGSYLVVGGINKNFVHNLEEAGHITDVAMHHSLSLRIENPKRSGDGLNTSNIRIRSLEDVFELRELPESCQTMGTR
jgi:hypothetical protein